MKVHLNLYKSMFDLKNGENGFFHQITINDLPKEGDFFEYTKSMFSKLTEIEQKDFLDLELQIGRFYISSIKDYREKKSNIDFILFLALDK